MKSIEEIIKQEEYKFIENNEHLGKNIIFLTLGGSHAYGTNISTSDIDIRGCVFNKKSDLIGLSSFNQHIDEVTDTTIYGFNKLVNLLSNCNPNVIEFLGCKPEHYLILNPVGQQLLDNKQMFLSKRAINSFGGYANQQLRRLQSAVARDRLDDNEKEKHIINSVKNAMFTFGEKYASFDKDSIEIFIGKSDKEDIDTEIFANVNLTRYPLRDYKNIWNDMNNVVKVYGKLNHRNKKKDDTHLNKHAMHLIRLYLMCLDILENEQIITYREKDYNLLMSIRNGKYQNEDSTYMPEFFELVSEYEKRLEYAKKNTSLPNNPNYNHIEEFVMSVNEKVIRNEY